MVGVDTGGTFTDFVIWRRSGIEVFKLPSTPRAPERAVLQGLKRAGVGPRDWIRHGFTVATNALLEGKGARVTLLTTAGFEDLLEIGRQDRPRIYDLAPRRVTPLVPRRRRLGVLERVGPVGQPWLPLTARALRRALASARRTRPQAVAVCLLHSYARPDHERRMGRALRALGVPVALSAELCPEVREYERMATTVTDAYLSPRLGRYLERLETGSPGRIEVMLSHGGTAPPRTVAAVRTLLSGPAGGAVAALERALAAGVPRALSLDVGGTSTDVAFLPGRLERRRDRLVGGFPIRLPTVDVHTVGAGGGSVARLDAGGLLEVGPESAGADPGPACYGRGGPATVTDALILLGRIVPDLFGGGALTIRPELSRRALERLGRVLRMSALEAARGVLRVANANMERALRFISVERGEDPRGAALVAFGGAGGLHACELAEGLGIRTVLAPRHAGLLSACGMVSAETRHERTRSVLVPASAAAGLDPLWRELERQVRAEFQQRYLPSEPPLPRLERWVEMRYRGQSHELSLPWGTALETRFHRAHERRYGYSRRDQAGEIVTLEVRGSAPSRRAVRSPAPRRRGAVQAWGWSRAPLSDGVHRVPVWRREGLPAGWHGRGPAVVVEYGAGLWIAPGWHGRQRKDGTLVLTRGGKR